MQGSDQLLNTVAKLKGQVEVTKLARRGRIQRNTAGLGEANQDKRKKKQRRADDLYFFLMNAEIACDTQTK